MTKGAVRAPQRNPATKVWVFQWPKGALDRRRLPFGQRPRRRVIFVVVPVSSRKTNLCGSSRILGCRALVHSSRACWTSGRSCSLATRVFFEAITVADEPARQRGGVGPNANGLLKVARQLRHGDVLLLGHTVQKELTMRIKLGVPASPARLRRQASGRPIRPDQIHDKRNRHFKMSRRRAPRVTLFNKGGNAFSQIHRNRLWHRKSPPRRSESQTSPSGNPPRFKLRIRRSSIRTLVRRSTRSEEEQIMRRFPNGWEASSPFEIEHDLSC